ncbi:MAG: 4Fe-4S binding protein [Deltaproteobacteria bacterium]|nr:4Fe-4S binding protein [Deltaproteobacteria bacterium]MBW2207867.1 4Fe-4S binding protein [Deltaproteobacteria bacterium]
MKVYSIQNKKRKTTVIKALSYLGLVYAVLGWLNEVFLHWTNSLLLSHYSEYIAIGVFGIYRVAVEKNPYTKKRIAVLTAAVLGFWALLPYLFALREPALGYFRDTAIWGRSLHLPMTLTFILSLVLVLLFGRRAVCSWNCPCVGTRDTMGAAFRKETIKTKTAWKSRHLKWVLTSFYFVLFIIVLLPFSKTKLLADAFLGIVGVIYFASFLFIPLTGNRNWCRWLCPFGQMFGILNKVGFYKIKAEKEKCISCEKCNMECDMGIPVQYLVETKGEVNVPDCVGCGRCVTNCPKGVLSFSDVRGLFSKPAQSAKQIGERKLEEKEVLLPLPFGRTFKDREIPNEALQGAGRGEVAEIDQRYKKTTNPDQNDLEMKIAKGGTS